MSKPKWKITRNQWLLIGLIALWCVFIALSSTTVVTIPQLANFVSQVSGGSVSTEQFTAFWLSIWWVLVKGWHAFEFGLIFWLGSKVFPKRKPWVAASVIVLAVLDEIHQTYVQDRGGRISDVLIDALGVWAAYALVPLFSQKSALHVRALGIFVFLLALYLLSQFPFGSLEPELRRAH